MGNGTKFKLSNVLPSVLNKIKGIGPRRSGGRKHKGSSSSAALSDYASSEQIDQTDFSGPSKHSRGERSLSPVRVFPQRRETRDMMVGYSSSPVPGQRTYDIRFPMESPVRSSRGSKSRSHSPHSPPAAQLRVRSSAQSDPGCCSFDSTMALAPHIDGRVRKAVPQALRACSIMSKCNSFNGSTHSDSELSETDTPTRGGGPDSLRHSRGRSVHLDGTSWSDGYVLEDRSGGGGRRVTDGPASARERLSLDLRDRSAQEKSKGSDRRQLYGGSSPNPAASNSFDGGTNSPAAHARFCATDRVRDSGECRGSSACPSNSSRKAGIDRELEQRAGGRGRLHRLTRNLSYTSDESGRPFDETSFSSDEQLHKGRRSKDGGAPSLRRSRSRSSATPGRLGGKPLQQQQQQQRKLGRSEDLDPGYTSSTSEMLLTEDERNHAAMLRREAVLARTVLNASDGWARLQLSRFSRSESPTKRNARHETMMHSEKRDAEKAVGRGQAAALASANDWALENLRALAKVNGTDREVLARLNAGHLDNILVNSDDEDDEADKIGSFRGFGLAPDSRARGFSKSSRNLSPFGKAEKLIDGEYFDSRSANDGYHAKEMAGGDVEYEGFLPLVGYASRLGKSGRTEKSDKEIGTPWDTEFPSFRSDSMLLEGAKVGAGRAASDERSGGLLDISESHVLTSRAPRHLERQRQTKIRLQGQHLDGRGGRIFCRSPSPREELVDTASKNSKLSNHFLSARQPHELGGARPGKLGSLSSLSSVPEVANGKKMSSRAGSPSPGQDVNGKRSSHRAQSPSPDFQRASDSQQGKKTGRTPSPARDQSARAAEAEAEKLGSIAEAGMQRLDSVAVVKASYDPYQDFRESMVEMILENDIRTTEDLEDLLQCYLSLNSSDYHKIIVQVFTDIWGEIFEQ